MKLKKIFCHEKNFSLSSFSENQLIIWGRFHKRFFKTVPKPASFVFLQNNLLTLKTRVQNFCIQHLHTFNKWLVLKVVIPSANGLFCLFSSFSRYSDKYSTIDYKWKKRRRCARDHWMEGADESTELWRFYEYDFEASGLFPQTIVCAFWG